jgi:hypothetical protein
MCDFYTVVKVTKMSVKPTNLDLPNVSGIYTVSDMAIVSGKFDFRTVTFRLENPQQQTAMACLFCWYSRYGGG